MSLGDLLRDEVKLKAVAAAGLDARRRCSQLNEQDEMVGKVPVDGERSMTSLSSSKLIAAKQSHLPAKDVELAVEQHPLMTASDALAQGHHRDRGSATSACTSGGPARPVT